MIRGRKAGTGSGAGRQAHDQGKEGMYRIRGRKASIGSGDRRQVHDQGQKGRYWIIFIPH